MHIIRRARFVVIIKLTKTLLMKGDIGPAGPPGPGAAFDYEGDLKVVKVRVVRN